jgi:hypothetical protein
MEGLASFLATERRPRRSRPRVDRRFETYRATAMRRILQAILPTRRAADDERVDIQLPPSSAGPRIS